MVDAAIAGAQCWWLAPTYAMAGQVWRDLKATFRKMDGAVIMEDERRIDLNGTGGMIAIKSTHKADFLRGAGLDFVVLDEAAYMTAEVWPEVVRPMLLDRGGRALFLSTPRGMNWFWKVYQHGLDPAEPDWHSFHFTSYANPYLSMGELDALRRTTPERIWREEYLAEFIADSGHVFRNLLTCATAPANAAPSGDQTIVGGLDWGRERDYTAFALIDTGSQQMVALDRFTGVPWAVQRDRIMALCAVWQPTTIWAEANSIGSVNIEALQAVGLPVRPFQTTVHSKSRLIESLALALEREEIGLLNDEVLLGELAAYTLERMASGAYRYSAPAGGHDDTVIALALAWHGVRYSGSVIGFA